MVYRPKWTYHRVSYETDGWKKIFVRFVDEVGNIGDYTSEYVFIQAHRPDVFIEYPNENEQIDSDDVDVYFHVVDEDVIYVEYSIDGFNWYDATENLTSQCHIIGYDGETFLCSNYSHWFMIYDLPYGINTIYLRAYDSEGYGSASNVTVNITYSDNPLPVINWIYPENNSVIGKDNYVKFVVFNNDSYSNPERVECNASATFPMKGWLHKHTPIKSPKEPMYAVQDNSRVFEAIHFDNATELSEDYFGFYIYNYNSDSWSETSMINGVPLRNTVVAGDKLISFANFYDENGTFSKSMRYTYYTNTDTWDNGEVISNNSRIECAAYNPNTSLVYFTMINENTGDNIVMSYNISNNDLDYVTTLPISEIRSCVFINNTFYLTNIIYDVNDHLEVYKLNTNGSVSLVSSVNVAYPYQLTSMPNHWYMLNATNLLEFNHVDETWKSEANLPFPLDDGTPIKLNNEWMIFKPYIWTESYEHWKYDFFKEGIITTNTQILVHEGNSYTAYFENATYGSNSFTLKCWDKIRSAPAETLNFFVDTRAPIIQIFSPTNGTTVNETILRFEVSDDSDNLTTAEVRIDGGNWTIENENTDIRYDYLEDGWHTIELRAEDSLGNIGYNKTTFYLDSTFMNIHIDLIVPSNPVAGYSFKIITNVTNTDPQSFPEGDGEVNLTLPADCRIDSGEQTVALPEIYPNETVSVEWWVTCSNTGTHTFTSYFQYLPDGRTKSVVRSTNISSFGGGDNEITVENPIKEVVPLKVLPTKKKLN